MSRMVVELAAHPELWETAELTAEAEMVDDEEALPGLALYITTTGRNNVALMQLAILWESLRLAGLMRCRSRAKADPALLVGNTVSDHRTPQLSQFLRNGLQIEPPERPVSLELDRPCLFIPLHSAAAIGTISQTIPANPARRHQA